MGALGVHANEEYSGGSRTIWVAGDGSGMVRLSIDYTADGSPQLLLTPAWACELADVLRDVAAGASKVSRFERTGE